MARRDFDHHDARIQGMLRRAYVDHGWTAATDDTPLSILLREEYDREALDAEEPLSEYAWPQDALPEDQMTIRYLKEEEAAAVAEWARKRQVQWLLGSGLHPYRIIQRFYSLLFVRHRDMIGPFNETWLAEMLGQGRAAMSALIKNIWTRAVYIKTGVMMVSGGQKSVESKAKYAANASKHKPRQKLDAASLDNGIEAAATKADAKAMEAKLKAAREAAERRDLARLTGCNPEDFDLTKIKPVKEKKR